MGVFVRWIHFSSVAVLIGGLTYARFIVGRLDEKFRPFILGAIVALLGSGLYNFFTKPNYPPAYHMWFGIKMLLALHVFGVGFLLAMPPASPEKEARQPRLMTGVVISGFCIILISAYLRWISLAITR